MPSHRDATLDAEVAVTFSRLDWRTLGWTLASALLLALAAWASLR